jgi:hypothetical protein
MEEIAWRLDGAKIQIVHDAGRTVDQVPYGLHSFRQQHGHASNKVLPHIHLGLINFVGVCIAKNAGVIQTETPTHYREAEVPSETMQLHIVDVVSLFSGQNSNRRESPGDIAVDVVIIERFDAVQKFGCDWIH